MIKNIAILFAIITIVTPFLYSKISPVQRLNGYNFDQVKKGNWLV